MSKKTKYKKKETYLNKFERKQSTKSSRQNFKQNLNEYK
jgi:hypothetical protein